jgi:hypothetical protein
MDTQIEKIPDLVRRLESDYTSSTQKHSKYVEGSMYEDVEKTDAYYNSVHTSGSTDALGRDKPFFNIVVAAVNIWFRATDIDRKHVNIIAKKSKHKVLAFLAQVLLHDWMKKANFGKFLNDWGRTLAKYGSAVVEVVDKGDELSINVVDWHRFICDPIDFANNPKIKKMEMTLAQLRENEAYDIEVIESLENSRATRKNLDGINKDNKADFITVYEVHGKFPLSLLTEDEKDNNTYVQQMHTICFDTVKKGRRSEYQDYCLYKGKEKQDPFVLTHLIEERGKTLSMGAVKLLFEAQWMVNHSIKAIKDHLDLASKLIFQTSDTNFVGKNALSNIETGDILVHSVNQPLTQMNNSSHDITSLQNFATQWRTVAQEQTSTPDALIGSTMPSGTAWRQVEALQQEAHSLFEVMTENKGLHLEDIMRRFVIPFLKRKIDTTEEVSALLSQEQIRWIDSVYVPNRAIKESNVAIVDQIIEGQTVTPEMQVSDIQARMQEIQQSLAPLGNQRFFKPDEIDTKTWKEALKDFEWEVEVEVTNENKDKQAILTTLSTIFMTIGRNPAILNDPKASFIFNKILEQSNTVSPLELAQVSAPSMQSQGGQVGGTSMEDMSNLVPQTNAA